MATDPMAPDDQKRRLRRETAVTGGVMLPPAAAAAGSFFNGIASLAGDDEEEEQQPTPPRAQPARNTLARQEPRVNVVRAQDPSRNVEADRRTAGLTRVFRTTDAQGNSVYSDQDLANTGGRPVETRYYGAQGMRADADFDPNRGDVAFDVSTPAGEQRLFRNAARQTRGLGRQIADARAVRDGNDPSNPRGLQFTQTEFGPRVTTQEERDAAAGGSRRGGGTLSDQIALLRLQQDMQQSETTNRRAEAAQDLQRRGLERQELADLRRFARDDPAAFLREELGALRGLAPEALDEYFNSDRGRFTQSAIDDNLARTYGDNAATFLGAPFLDTPANLGDLQPAPWYSGSATGADLLRGQRYVTPGDTLQRGIRLEDLGLAPGDEWLLDYFARRNAQQGQ